MKTLRLYRTAIHVLLAIWWCGETCPGSATEATSSPFEPTLRFGHYSIDDGLSASVVLALLQDRQGFLWIGTQVGLNRFDGAHFEVFKPELDNPDSLPSSYVTSLHEDARGNIWIGTYNGLAHYEASSGGLRSYRPVAAGQAGLQHGQVFDMAEDRHGYLWVVATGGLARLPIVGADRRAPPAAAIRNFHTTDGSMGGLDSDRLNSVLIDRHGALWLGARGGGGLYRLPPESVENPVDLNFESYRHLPDEPTSLANDTVLSVHEDDSDRTWIGTAAGVCRLLDAQGSFSCELTAGATGGQPPATAWSLASEAAGVLWVGTDAGLLRRDGENRYRRLLARPREKGHLVDDFVNSLLVDATGVLWIGTDAGLHTLDTAAKGFDHLFAGYQVWAVTRDHLGALWVGTSEGLFVETADGQVHHHGNDRADPASLSHDVVWSLFEDSSGTLWVGTNGGGLNRFDRASNSFQRFPHGRADEAAEFGSRITAIAEDASGRLWVGATAGGLSRFDPDSGGFQRYSHNADDPASLGHSSVVGLLSDSVGRLWVGTHRGVDLYQPADDSFSHFVHHDGDPSSLSENRIVALAEGRDGTLWVGTAGGGLNALDPDSGRSTVISTRQGLPDDVIYGILEAENGDIWVSTNHGLACLATGSDRVRSYSSTDGLQSNEFNFRCAAKDPDGRLMFGGVNGLTVFDPATLSDNLTPPPVVLTGVKIFNRPATLPCPPSQLEELELSWRDTVVTFQFAALSYNHPAGNRYAYRLQGFDRQWNHIGNLREATYTNLDPGSYTLRVKAANHDGVWNDDGLSLALVVRPPLWRTWWFETLAVLALAAALFSGHRYRVRALEQRRRQLEALVDERTRELARQRDLLEKTNAIVKSINSETGFEPLLYAILNEARVIAAVDDATFLVRDRATRLFRVRAGLAGEPPSAATLSEEAITSRYLASAEEIHPGTFVVRHRPEVAGEPDIGPRPCSTLVLTVVVADELEGLLVLDNHRCENAFDDQDIELLAQLKEHVLSAFLRTRLLRDLGELSDRKSEVLRIAAHDFKSPLTSIVAFLQTMQLRLERGSFDPLQGSARIEQMLEVSGRTLQLLDRLLDLSAVESGSETPILEPVNMAELVAERVALHRASAEAKSIDLSFDSRAQLPPALADRMRLVQVIDNLVSNAVKYTHPGGRVELAAQLEDGFVVTRVRDTGQGLGTDDLEQVFHSFKRLSARPTGGESSAGLGLAIARSIVDMHGGKIWVDSIPGEGSTFSFSIPISSPHGSEPGGTIA